MPRAGTHREQPLVLSVADGPSSRCVLSVRTASRPSCAAVAMPRFCDLARHVARALMDRARNPPGRLLCTAAWLQRPGSAIAPAGAVDMLEPTLESQRSNYEFRIGGVADPITPVTSVVCVRRRVPVGQVFCHDPRRCDQYIASVVWVDGTEFRWTREQAWAAA